MSVTTDQRLEAIKRGRDYLQDHEWCQQTYFKYDDDGPDYTICDVIGALAAANGWIKDDEDNPITDNDVLDEAVAELNADLPHQYDDIVALNDAATEKRHVIDQMNKTLVRLAALNVAPSGVS